MFFLLFFSYSNEAMATKTILLFLTTLILAHHNTIPGRYQFVAQMTDIASNQFCIKLCSVATGARNNK